MIVSAMWVIDISHVFRENDVLFSDNKNNDKDYIRMINLKYERQLLFGEVKSSLGAYPALSKTSY